jgi:hypothetical protein
MNKNDDLTFAFFGSLAALWAFFAFWPWSLTVILGCGALALLLLRPLRRRVHQAFKEQAQAPEIITLRRGLSGGLALLAALAALACALVSGARDLQWWFAPTLLSAVAAHLLALSLTVPRGRQAVCKSLLQKTCELLLTAGIILALYSLARWRLAALPLDGVLLGRLREWQHVIQETHEWLERYKPGFPVLVALAVAASVLRVIADSRAALAGPARQLSAGILRGLRWSGRTAVAASIAGCLTFLGTQETGLFPSLTLTLKEADRVYDSLQSAVDSRAGDLLDTSLVTQAWELRPASVRALERPAAQFIQERTDYESRARRAQAAYGLMPSTVQLPGVPANTGPSSDTPRARPEAPEPEWTLTELNAALSEARRIPAPPAPRKEGEAATDISKDALAGLVAEHLLKMGSAAALKEHFPVFGDVLEMIVSAAGGLAYDRMRENLIHGLIARRAADHTASLDNAAVVAVREKVSAVHLDWDRFTHDWQGAAGARLAQGRQGIEDARSRLDSAVRAASWERLNARLGRLRRAQAELIKLAQALGSDALLRRAQRYQALTFSVMDLGRTWPALDPPTQEQQAALADVAAELHTLKLVGLSLPLPPWSPHREGTSLAGLEPLRRRRALGAETSPRPVESLADPLDALAVLESSTQDVLLSVIRDHDRDASVKLRDILVADGYEPELARYALEKDEQRRQEEERQEEERRWKEMVSRRKEGGGESRLRDITDREARRGAELRRGR